jgi:hypothetical protein
MPRVFNEHRKTPTASHTRKSALFGYKRGSVLTHTSNKPKKSKGKNAR